MNSATRLLKIYEYFNATPTAAIGTLLASYIGVDGNGNQEAVMDALKAVRGEISQVQKTLARLGLPEELFATHAQELRVYFSVGHHGSPWHSVGAPPNVAARRALMWASYILEVKSEPEVSEAALRAIAESIETQTKLLHETEMPYVIQEILERQISELSTALATYKISGIQAVIDVVNQQVGEMVHTSPEVQEELAKASPEVKGIFKRGCAIVVEVAKVAETGDKLFKFGKGAIELGQMVMKLLP